MDPTRQKLTGIHLNRHNSPTPTIDGIRGHRAIRHQYSNDTLHHRAKTMETIRRDLPARRCVPPNSGLLTTSHLLRRDITSDARNPLNLSRKPTYPSGIQRHTLLPLSRHLPREISQPTLVATNSHHLLSPGQKTPIGQVHICI